MKESLKAWLPESGWEDTSKNAVLLEENGMLTTENFRSIYYNLEVPMDRGAAKITMDICTENSFRVLLCSAAQTRNPTEREISGVFGRTVLLHLNHLPQKNQIISETSVGPKAMERNAVLAENAEAGRCFRFEIAPDFRRKKEGRDWIYVKISDPDSGRVHAEPLWLSSVPGACDDALAQIRIVFKTYRKNRKKTWLKDFSIEYDKEAADSCAPVKTAEEIEKEYADSAYSLDRMMQDVDALSAEDAVRDLVMTYTASGMTVCFPVYRYKDQAVYDEKDMQALYDSGERRLLIYSEVGGRIRNAAAAAGNLTRDKMIQYLLSVLDGTAELSAEERITALEIENAEMTVDMEYRLSCLEMGL